jgi:hypothetical protein
MRAIYTIMILPLILACPKAQGGPTPEHSKVEVTQEATAKSLTLTFKVVPQTGMTVTADAPWKLEIEAPDLPLVKNPLGKGDLREGLPGFVVETQERPKTKDGELKYKLTSFICTKEKTQCYRDVHTGSFRWSSP